MRYMRWTKRIELITAFYLREIFELPSEADVPPVSPHHCSQPTTGLTGIQYIAIHVRHGDFGGWCWEAENPEDCFAPISAIALRVRWVSSSSTALNSAHSMHAFSEVQAELRERRGIDIPSEHVIITSDEKDPAWWDEVKSLGWKTVDHDGARTAEVFGRWYPVILDAAIQSQAHGFVGTDRSTFSIVSRRRVQQWNDGAVRVVKWGFKGADDH